ncbi:unnamed protein product [Closterium sp. NIES-53]
MSVLRLLARLYASSPLCLRLPSARQVALCKWLRVNVTSVVAIFEDRFLLWGLRRSSPPPAIPTAIPTACFNPTATWASPEPSLPASSQQQHVSQLPPVSFSNDFNSAHSATARGPLLWLQGLLSGGRASSAGGAGSGDSGMSAAVRVAGAGVGEDGGHGRSEWHAAVVARKEEAGEGGGRGARGAAGEGGWAGGSGAAQCGGQQIWGAAAAERMASIGMAPWKACKAVSQLKASCAVPSSLPLLSPLPLSYVPHRKLLVVVALELSDLLMPLFKAAVTAAGRAVSFLVALVDRLLGLVYRGIRQSWGQAL